MQKKHAGIWIISWLLLWGAGSCTKNFDRLNTDPNAYDSASYDPNHLLTTAQLAYAGSVDFSYDTWRANLIYCSAMMQQFATVINYWAGDKYLANEDYTSAYWSNANGTAGGYPEQVKPIVHLVEMTRNRPANRNLHQVARIMKAMIFQRLTDLYGDIPYSAAGLGYYGNVPFPVYDKQEEIYRHLMGELEDAAGRLDLLGDRPAGDAIYGGDPEKWKRFAYSLLLRAGMRLSKADESFARSIVGKVAGKTMQGNSDNAFLVHDRSGARTTVNRNSQILLGGPERDFVKWSRRFINELQQTGDPRLSRISATRPQFNSTFTEMTHSNTDPKVQKGQPNGYDLSGRPGLDISSDSLYTQMPDYSAPGRYLRKLDGPTFFLTYAETELLLADAAVRWGTGDAALHYHRGVKAAMTFLGSYDPAIAIPEGEAENYLLRNPYRSADGLRMINTQYWIHTATMLDFYESWSNWRRTGYPRLQPVLYPNNATNGQIPRRFPYPASEANTNPLNYRKAAAEVPGGDNLNGRVWWDK